MAAGGTAGGVPNTGGVEGEAKRGGGKFSLGSLQAAAMSEFITELAVRKKRDGESWSRGGR